ncbi:tripartite tricarboxylate transporter TctB family protein [Orrella daihaiensis]|uniref:Tripartite tricarboxylate transporter TctB family protein n=1 Tax=Orrella daihaiensis TaxID=2782176 RepID=A0ABY4ALP1_9BURK|nr:tripartite tricarboxylate transporter TctB family protein [Orrella daihaiensis]UOD49987.1 tripartite tricarboxylate transporter TctB family protein [Orrella daihaiensis]
MTWVQALNKVKYELLMLLVLVGYATQYYLEIYSISSKRINLLLVEPVYWALMLCAVALITQKVRAAKSSEQIGLSNQEAGQPNSARRQFYRDAFVFSVLTLIYALALDRIGFVVSSFLYLALLTYSLGARKIWLTIALPAAVVGFIYVSMSIFLRFSLPEGILI